MKSRWLFAVAWTLLGSSVQAVDWLYTVRPGDNLWTLSERHLIDGFNVIEPLRKYNKLANPDHLPPGRILRVPVEWLKVQPVSARLAESQGSVRVLRLDGTVVDGASPDAELNAGDRVVTGPEGFAIIEFANRSRVIVREKSTLVLDALSAYGTTGMVDSRLRLDAGRAESVVTPSPNGVSRYEISTPAAIAAVRGTNFRMSVGGDDATRSEVTQGAVALAASVGGSTKSETVKEGFGTVVELGQAPQPPRALLPAPDLGAMVDPQRRLSAEIEWPPVDGAVRYRVELFTSAARTALVLDELVDANKAVFTSPPDGEYWLQIRAVDAVGLEGFEGARILRIDARPVPPSLLQPADGARIHSKSPRFWWGELEGVMSYALQIARDAEFRDLIVDESGLVPEPFTMATVPPPGTYYWRVASRAATGPRSGGATSPPGGGSQVKAISGAGGRSESRSEIGSGSEQGPFGSPRRFEVLVVPDPVATGQPAIDDQGLTLSWQAAAHAAKYQLELATDSAFESLVLEETLTGLDRRLEAPDPGIYYFRIRALSRDGVLGPVSPANRFEVPDNFDRSFLYMLLAPLLILL